MARLNWVRVRFGLVLGFGWWREGGGGGEEEEQGKQEAGGWLHWFICAGLGWFYFGGDLNGLWVRFSSDSLDWASMISSIGSVLFW